MPWRKTLYPSLSLRISQALSQMSKVEAARLLEIRARIGQPLLWIFADGVRACGAELTNADMDELLSALCGYSRYAFEAQMAQGFIPLNGGHRAGVCGRVAYEEEKTVRMSAITSVCIRIAREVDGASRSVRRYLAIDGRPSRVLLLGPPGCGKTTVLRDAAKYLARDCGLRVAVADEREELFGAQAAFGMDVLLSARKAEAMRMLVRSMSPQALVTDEIGRMEDADALLDAASCGVGLLASAHAAGIGDVLTRPVLRTLFEARAFERYILLGRFGALAGVWDGSGKEVLEGNHGKLGCGGDGDDWRQRDCLSAGGWRKAPPEVDSGDAQVSFAAERRHTV